MNEESTTDLTFLEAYQKQLLSEIDLAHIYSGVEIFIWDTSDMCRLTRWTQDHRVEWQ